MMTDLEPSKNSGILLLFINILVILGVCSLQGFWIARSNENYFIYSTAISRCNGAFESIKFSLGKAKFLSESTAAFFQSRKFKVTREEFKTISNGKHFVDVPVLQAIEWIPKVTTEKQRNELEDEGKVYTRGPLPSEFTNKYPKWNYSFHQTINGTKHTNTPKNTVPYWPVHYVEPLVGNEAALGFRVDSSSTRLAAITSAVLTQQPVATSRITLVQSSTPQYSFVYFEPIGDGGLIASVFKYDVLLGEVLKRYELSLISIGLFDINTKEEYLAHYLEGEEPRSKFEMYKNINIEGFFNSTIGEKKDRWVEETYLIAVGTRKWKVVCGAGKAYFYSEASNITWIMFFWSLGIAIGQMGVRYVLRIGILVLGARKGGKGNFWFQDRSGGNLRKNRIHARDIDARKHQVVNGDSAVDVISIN